MGRRTLIAPFTPFIDYVREDLHLIKGVTIQWKYSDSRTYDGMCHYPYIDNHHMSYYLIKIDREVLRAQSRYSYETIAHELRHAWQMQRMYLWCEDDAVYWKRGRTESVHSYKSKHANFLEYDKRPEEKDASTYARRIYLEWIRYGKITRI